MKLLLLLIGMVLILEGMPYVAAPETMRDWLKKLSEMSAQQLRVAGMVSMIVGLVICWLVDPVSFLR